jgi:hypothetical protein
MAGISNPQLWNNRLDSFVDATNAFHTSYATVSSPQVQRVGQAVECLQAYVTALFRFFQTHLQNGNLKESSEHPADNVLSIILNQAMYDLEVLQRVAEQRLSSPSALADGLRQADYLAADVVGRAVAGGLLAETEVLTYYQKSPSIRVIPYTNLALIGVPYTALDEPRDYLAIPHEVGHYAFWHGRAVPAAPPCGREHYYCSMLADDAKAALDPYAQFPQWAYVWLEELFADVFGCWLVGPAAALTVQHVMRNHTLTEFITSDGDHPVPVLRPYLHMKALHARDLQSASITTWTPSADLLKADWDIEARRHTTEFDVGEAAPVEIADALVAGRTLDTDKPLDVLIDLIVNRLSLFNLAPADWRDPQTTPADIATLDQQVGAFLVASASAAREAGVQNGLPLACTDFKTWALCRFDWSGNKVTAEVAQARQALQELLNDDNFQVAAPIDEAAWWPLVQGAGWTNEPDIPRWP